MEQLTMSMFAKREHYLEAKVKQQAKALAELALFFTSANGVPVERATIRTSDFLEITGVELPNAS